MANKALDAQVESGDSLTIEDVKQFIIDCRKKRQDFITIADRSWAEIEKRNKRGGLYGGNDLFAYRRWTKYPLWWSCLKIRQPITLARMPVPVLKDTQGDDPYGRTACIIGERLTRGILKTFEAFPEFSAGNDDFLVTNFAQGRWFYRSEEVLEEEKVRLQVIEPPQEPVMGPDGQPIPQEPMPPIFLTPSGEIIPEPLFDEFGPYILTGQKVFIDNEEVYFAAGLYSGLYVDPDCKRWSEVTRVAFEYQYSYREFIAKFGKKALEKLAISDIEEHRTGKPIIVFEYHDKLLKECRWLAENSDDFFQPQAMADVESLTQVKDRNGYDNSDLYGLSGFFPCTEPLVINQSTKEFWPTPEYFQVQDILEDIHSIVSRMMLLTRAIRVRFLFDSSVRELKSLIGENWAAAEGTGLGIPNLEQSLMNNKGDLSALVAYFPVEEMIEGLKNMYEAFEQRLNMFYNVTGISDLIRGQTAPDSDKTYGERQLEGKFALNRIEPFQRKLQEWIKDNLQLGMEMALKMFSEQTLDDYITPQTLDREDRERYLPALELLKNNRRRRFRIEFETDSTIAINEQWRRQQAIETANVITKMQESVANTAENMPELAESQLKLMDHVIGELTDGKLFRDEISDSIMQTIDRVTNKPAAPNAEMEKINLEKLKLQATQQIELATLAQKERFATLEGQLEQIRIGAEAGWKQAELNQKAQQLMADLTIAQDELAAKRAEFLLHVKEVASKTEAAQLQLLLDSRVAEQKQQLEEIRAETEKQLAVIQEQEKWVTEQRLQQEHVLNQLVSLADVHKTLAEIKKTPPTVNLSLPEPKRTKRIKKGKVTREDGSSSEIIIEEES